MAEPTQSRVDLSGIHPLKRVTLIGLDHFGLGALKSHLSLTISWPALPSPPIDFLYGDYDGGRMTAPMEHSLDLAQISYVRLAPLSGLTIYRIYCLPPTLADSLTIKIHHAWLISITAALYLFARWRIRSSAIILNQPS